MSPTKKKTSVKKAGRGSRPKRPASKKAPPKKRAAKKAAAKKKPAPKTTPKKAAAKKAAAKKAPPAKKAAVRKAPAAAPQGKAGPAKPARTRRARQKTSAAQPPPAPTSRLGVKYVCFACGAKFYDLNRPEPLCPKCGTDQRTRPKQEAKPKPASGSRRANRAMAPLLAEDEDEAVAVESDDIEVELGADGAFLDEATDAEEEEPEEP